MPAKVMQQLGLQNIVLITDDKEIPVQDIEFINKKDNHTINITIEGESSTHEGDG